MRCDAHDYLRKFSYKLDEHFRCRPSLTIHRSSFSVRPMNEYKRIKNKTENKCYFLLLIRNGAFIALSLTLTCSNPANECNFRLEIPAARRISA